MRRYILLLLLLGYQIIGHSQVMGPWSNTGPIPFPINVSGQVDGIGRVSQVKFHPTNPAKMYAVSASGGLFITSDTGHNWAPTAGSEQLPQTSCSAVCIDYTNDQTLYLSLGDADYYSNNYGIYKSTNGGLTWAASNTGIGTTMAVEILMHPTNNQVLVAATRNGIWKTTNAGASWTQKQSTTNFRDMKAQPVAGSLVLYAATATTAYYSNDFGDTWVAATGVTAPGGNDGMRLAVSNAAPTTVYLAACSGNGVVWKSTNSGVSYTQIYSSTTQCISCYDAAVTSSSQGNYNFDINANPTNASELLLVAHCVWRSTDGGLTWSKRTSWPTEMHTDMHHIQWNPYDNSQRWCANDGGVWMSTDPVATIWTTRSDGLAATEIYHAAQSPVIRELVSIGTQDNGELYYSNGIWRCNRGGDWGSRNLFDYSLNGTVYYLENGKKRPLTPQGSEVSYNEPFAGTNNAYIDFVRNLPGTAFIAKDSIWRCTNINTTTPAWTLVNIATAPVRALCVSAADSNIVFMVNNANRLLRSKDALSATPTFTSITTPGTTTNSASVTTVKGNKAIVFMSCGANVYRSADTGNTWTNITGTGLSGLNIRRIVHDDYSTNERLFVNAGSYLHYKNNTSTSWTNHSSNMGLPTVCNVSDLMIYNNGTAASILRLSTYGRGVWQCGVNENLVPSVDFTADKQIACPGDTVRFTSTVYGTGPISYSWSFTGGSPSSSTLANPVIVYNTPGIYPVTLNATNVNGTGTQTKTGYIAVSIGQTAAVQEGFEGAGYPPTGWQLVNTSGSDWALTAAAGGFGTSAHSIIWDNYNIDGQGKRDRIVAPKLDLTGVTAAQLKFDVAYAPYSTAYPDSLQVRVSTNCGNTWTVVYSKTGTALGTAAANTGSTFVPQAGEWRTETVSLTPFVNNGLLISFDNIGRYGQALYLDNINITPAPLATFSANDTTVCVGTPVTFTDASANAGSWNWSFPGGSPATSTQQNPTVSYATAGTFNVTLTTANSAGTGVKTKTNYITVYALPNPVISVSGNTLSTTGGGTYQWYLNGTAISGATGSSYTPSVNGSYTVQVTNVNGCIGTSTAFSFTRTGVQGITVGSTIVTVYPNPSHGNVTLQATGKGNRDIAIACYSNTGQLVKEGRIMMINGTATQTFDWRDLAKGIYTIQVQVTGGEKGHLQLVLQ